MKSYTQEVQKTLNTYFKDNGRGKGELFPIIYVSPEFFEFLYKEKPLELDAKLGKYCMMFEKYSLVVSKKLSGTTREIKVV
jgi:hypothetical protein